MSTPTLFAQREALKRAASEPMLQDPALTMSDKAVGMALVYLFLNAKSGLAWPTLGTLSRRFGCSRSTVERALRRLCGPDGWLVRLPGRRKLAVAINTARLGGTWPDVAKRCFSDPQNTPSPAKGRHVTGDAPDTSPVTYRNREEKEKKRERPPDPARPSFRPAREAVDSLVASIRAQGAATKV